MLHDRLQRARLSLLGLAAGDALGSQFFVPANRHHLAARSLPPAPWQWTAARHLTDYQQAIWTTAAAGGDIDTTCAIVGGITAGGLGSNHLPDAWRQATEPLPAWSTPGKMDDHETW